MVTGVDPREAILAAADSPFCSEKSESCAGATKEEDEDEEQQ